ncbi:MAG: lytic murein transglycosylase [Proteobacteria bacterium]|nr:lytic murein transglycosylase [Pseudomonadota bacterium]
MKKLYRWLGLGFLISIFAFASVVIAAPRISFEAWLADFKKEAVADGIDPNFFDQLYKNIRPDFRILRFDHSQPEHRLTYLEYRNSRANTARISLGRIEFRRNADLLHRIGQHYGVNPCVITALWGMETSYGRYMGDFPVITALTTLAYDNRRGDFFRKELLIALHILSEGHVSLAKFKGEWAGGTGQTQFLPSSWKKYAVDYEGDGHKDIWTSRPDVFASIANYMAINGWKAGEPSSIAVNVPSNLNPDPKIPGPEKTLKEWFALGVQPIHPQSFANENLMASLIQPEGGPGLLILHNFQVIMTYNHSTFYAATIGYLADEICGRS